MTIAVRISACGSGLAAGPGSRSSRPVMIGGTIAGQAAGGEDQQVDGVAEEGDAEQHADHGRDSIR